MNNQGNFPNMGMRPTMNQGQMTGQNMQQQQQQPQMMMMEQLMNSGNTNPMMNLFQSNLQGMNQQQRAMFFENFQRNFQMMQQQSNSSVPLQQQGIMGNGNAGMLNMMQGNPQAQGMMGQNQGINPQVFMQQALSGQQQRPAMQQPQMHQTVGGMQRQIISQGQPQQASGDRTSPMISMGQSQQERTPSQGIPTNRNPSVYTQNSGQGSQSNTSKSGLHGNLNESSKIRGILKNSQSASAAPSSNVTSSEKEALSSTKWKNDKLKEMLKAYLYPSEDDESSNKDSGQKQTGTLSHGKIQTVHTSISNTKTSPFLKSAVDSSAKQAVNVSNSGTSRSGSGAASSNTTTNRVQSNLVSSFTAPQTKSSTVTSQSAQRSHVEGRSIPTLVSSGLRKQKDQPVKRKADVDIGTDVKKAKVTAPQATRVQPELEDEDPEYVQAQVFISNIPRDTTKGMILDILQHYNFTSPKVWIGRHSNRKDQICAFVKLPSLKDSKRVIAEMKGFPYKGQAMEIRFSAAADFIEYTVPNDGTSQSQVARASQPVPAPRVDTSIPPPGTSHHPVAQALPIANPSIPPPTILHPLSGSAIPVETIPAVVQAPVQVDPVAYPHIAVPVYPMVPPSAHDIYTTPVGYRIDNSDRSYSDRDRSTQKSTDNYSDGSYRRDYRRSVSPRDRRGYSPQYSSNRERYPSPYESSGRDRRLSPDYSSRGRHSSPGYSPHRRYSRSPDYRSQSPDRRSYRRSRSRSPYDSHSRERGYHSPTRDRRFTPDYSTRRRSGYENSPLDDRYARRDRGSSFDYPAGRDRRSSLSPDGRYRDSPHRGRSPEGSLGVPNIDGHGHADTYCIHIENLPADIKDSELEALIEAFLYKSVRLKVRDGNAAADINVASSTEAKIMTQQLNGRRFMGAELRVDWYRVASTREREERMDDRNIPSRSPDRRESIRSSTGYSDRERSRRSLDRDQSVRSERDHSRQSLERDVSRRSLDRERSRRSPDRDKPTRSGGKIPAWDERDSYRDTEKSQFQSFLDASYPNAPVLGRKYIKEFSSKDSNTAYYICILCEMTLTWKDIADHMMGYKHRLKCIKRSHPKIYDKICLIQNKVDMLGQCAKYALELENKRERIVRVDTPHPESTAHQHLKKIKGDKTSDKDKRDDRKEIDDDASKAKEEKADEKSPDSTSDIFKKIEAYKKKFEASKDTPSEGNSGESQAKKPRIEERKKSAMSFEDLAKQNKTLAESIQKGIESARKGAEEKKTTTLKKGDWQKEITAAKKRAEILAEEGGSKMSQTDIGKKEVTEKKLEVSKNISEKGENELDKQKSDKETPRKLDGKTKSGNEKVGESKNLNTKNTAVKVSEAKSPNNKTIKENISDSKTKISTTGEITAANDDGTEDLTIDPEDIEELGKSISAELFGEELGNMEDEDVVEEKAGPAKGKMSNHRLSKLQKYFDMQLLKDPESSGIVGLQYVIEVIPLKAGKAHVYKCTLCNVRCATTSIVDHILGYKHRMKYFEIHNFEIYSNIMKMDQSRKFLNAECTKYAKSIQEKEGLKTVMSLTEAEFKQREKMINQEREEEKKREKSKQKTEPSTPKVEEKKKETAAVKIEETKAKDVPEVKEMVVEQVGVDESPKSVRKGSHVGLGRRITEAKAAAKLVSHYDGRETVELYKYIQHKPDVPLLGLSNVTEIQGLYGSKSKTVTYCCQLCLPATKIDGTANMYEHLTGIKHMENYLKKHYPYKMIHLKLISQNSAKNTYLHNQAKLLCQAQMKEPESIYVVNLAQMEEDKIAFEMAQAAAKAVEEAAKAEADALAAAKQDALETSEPSKHPDSKSTPEGVIDLTAEEVKYEPLIAQLYTKLAGLEDIPLVGLSYITEIQGICADKVPPRYECRLCDNDLITANYINAHITDTEHRMRFLKINYPVFYSRALGDRDQTEKLCREIEQQFGRESISVKKRILVRPDGSVVYSDPAVVKAPVENQQTEKRGEKDITEDIENVDEVMKEELEEGEQQEGEIVFYKIVEGLDCTPMLGLQYIKEVQHPTLKVPPVYECGVCNIKNGPYLNKKNILKHICSIQHRLSFMRENHFHLYTEILYLSTEEQRKVAIDKHTKEIESKVGRGAITRVTSDKPVYWSKTNVETSQAETKSEETSLADEELSQYKCKKCSMIVAKDRRRAHIIAVHVGCYKCRTCQLAFPDHLYLQKHVTLIHKSKQAAPNANVKHNFNMAKWFSWYSVRGKPFPADPTGKLHLVCKECNKVVNLGQAEEHYILSHVNGYKCRVCSIPHGSHTALEKHLQKKHNIIENIPIGNYTEGLQLSKKYIHVWSAKSPEVIDLTKTSDEGVKKYVCTRCPQSVFVDGNKAELHYRHNHFFEYPCTMCKYIFRVAAHLEKHYKEAHKVYRSVKTPVIPFESCFHVIRNDGKRMLLGEYLKSDDKKDLLMQVYFPSATAVAAAAAAAKLQKAKVKAATASQATSSQATASQQPAASSTLGQHEQSKVSVATAKDSVATTIAATTRGQTTVKESPAKTITATTRGPSTVKESPAKTIAATTRGPTTVKESPAKTIAATARGPTTVKESAAKAIAAIRGPINLDLILCNKEDPQFDWDTEYAKIKERMESGGITSCARKSKFMINYTSTFSNYPLIGLQMVKEFQQRDIKAEPWYLCELCKDRINWRGIMPHISSLKHRINYLEKQHPVLHKMITQKKFDSLDGLTSKVETLSQGVVKKEGKQFSITVMIELPPGEKALTGITQTEQTKAVQGTDALLHTDLQATSQTKTDTAKASANTTAPSEAKSTHQQQPSTNSGNGEENRIDEPRKKLPAWVKIPRLAKKDSQALENTDKFPAKTKETGNKKGLKTDDGKELVKKPSEQPSDSKEQDEERRSKSQDRRRSGSRSRDRRSSRRDGSRGSKDRSRRSPERGSRYSREDSSRKRRRSRSKDKHRTDTKSPRIGHIDSARESQKEKDKRDAKNPTMLEKTTSADKNVKNQTGEFQEETTACVDDRPTDRNVLDPSNDKLPGTEKPDTLEETENVINVDDFSLEELELIGKSIEQQMEEADDLILVEDDTEENSTEKNDTVEIIAPVKESAMDRSGNECVIEINTNTDEGLQIKDEVGVPDETVFDLVPETPQNKISTRKNKASDSCIVEITMTSSSPEKADQSKNKTEEKVGKVSIPDASSVVGMNMQQKELDESCSVTLEIEETKQNNEKTTCVPDEGKEVPQKDTGKENWSDRNVAYTHTFESKRHVDESQKRTESKLLSLSTKKVQFQPKTTELRIDVVADTYERNKSNGSYTVEDNSMVTTDANEDSSDEITTPSDFEDFIASQLGEEFVTVDDIIEADADLQAEFELGHNSYTGEENVVTSDISPKKSVTEISMELEEMENSDRTGEKNEIGLENESTEYRLLKDLQGKQNISESEIDVTDVQIKVSSTKTEKETKLVSNNGDKGSEYNQINMPKTPEIPSFQDQNIDTYKKEQNVNTKSCEDPQNVCVVEISMEPSYMSENSALPEETGGLFDPYDDSGDMEFVLTEDFETVDETEENGIDIESSLTDNNIVKEIDESDKSTSANTEQEQTTIKEDKDNLSISSTKTAISSGQVNTSKEIIIQVEEPAITVEPQEKVVEAVSNEIEGDMREEQSPVVITSFPMDEDDDDDIEEIFLGGNFVTVDEHKEDAASPTVDTGEEDPTVDTAEEEGMDVDFDPDDFVTLDEIDTDASADQKKLTDQLMEDKSSAKTNMTSGSEDRPKHSSTRGGSRSSSSREKSFSRDGDRCSKDKSESKKSSHSSSNSRSSSSRMRETERQSSSKKRDSSRTSRHSSPEKSTKPSSSSSSSSSNRASRGSGTTSGQKSGSYVSNKSGSQKDTLTSSVEIGSTDSRKKTSDKNPSGIEVNVQVLSKQSVKEQVSIARSTRSSDKLRSYTVKQDMSPRKIDTQSFLGIPIKPATESPSSKQPSKAGKQDKEGSDKDKNLKPNSSKNKQSGDRGKASADPETDKTSVNKQVRDRAKSATNVSDDKQKDLKSSHDRHKDRDEKGRSRNERSDRSRDRGDNRHSSRGRTERRDKRSNECEISIEIG